MYSRDLKDVQQRPEGCGAALVQQRPEGWSGPLYYVDSRDLKAGAALYTMWTAET